MLNIEKIGRPLMKITGGPHKDKIVSVHTEQDKNAKLKFNSIGLPEDKDQEFTHVPNHKTNREVLYIAGPSGSGKTYYTKKYIKELIKKNPKMNVYLISPFSEDKSLDDINPKRIKLDQNRYP